MKIGETTFDNGLEKLDLKNPILLKSLDFDKFYQVKGPTKTESFTLRNLIIIPENKSKTDLDILSEIELQEYLQKIPKKPLLFPLYRGYIKNKEDIPQMTSYTLIFEGLEKSLEHLICEKQQTQYFSFNTVEFYFKSFVNGLAFMQTLDLYALQLFPENIFVTSDNILKFLTFTDQKQFAKNSKLKRRGFIAPEVFTSSDWDIYKADVFTLAIIILYIATFQIPRQEIILEDANGILEFFGEFYLQRANNDLEKKKIIQFKSILKEMLGESQNRPDFIGLFHKLMDFGNKQKLREHILIEDGFFKKMMY